MKSATQSVRVDLDARSYDIVIGEGLLERAGEWIAPLVARRKTVIVTDENVARHQLPKLVQGLESAGMECASVILPPGDGTKDFIHLQQVLAALIDAGTERNDTIIAFGGGMVGDLAGFAAAVYLRGIDFIQIPTTLLALVDSSVGGKTAINTEDGKNLVGAFHQPRLVLADLTALETLPHRELLAGYAETVKYGFIRDRRFFEWLDQQGDRLLAGDADALAHAVATSCSIKSDIVAGDETEQGLRSLLNFGHTFGHAIEAATGFGDRLLHGEAVSIGMALAFTLSQRLGLCTETDASRAIGHLSRIGLPVTLADIAGEPPATDAILEHMQRDKKVRDGTVRFVLAKGIGEALEGLDADMGEVRSVIEQSRAS